MEVTPRGNTTVLIRGSTGITGGTSQSSIRPISDIGRLLIPGRSFPRGWGRERGDESPRYHSFPPAGQFAPPSAPLKIERPPGEAQLMAHRSSFAFSGDSQEFALPAPGCFSSCYQPALPGGGMIVAAATTRRISAYTLSHLLRLLLPLLRGAVNREFVCCPGLPASLARGRKRSCESDDHENREKSCHDTPHWVWVSPSCFCLPNLRRQDTRAVAVPFAIRWKTKAVWFCPTRK